MKAISAGCLAASLLSTTIVAEKTVSFPLSKLVARDDGDLQPAKGIYKRQESAGETVEQTVFDILPWSTGGAFYTNITVGTPPQPLTVLLDTGSSDLYLDASSSQACQDTSSPYTCRGGSFDPSKSSTYQVTQSNGFQTQFGDGSTADGDFATDTVQIGDVVLENVQMGIATNVNSTTGYATSLMGVGYSYNEASRVEYPNMPDLLAQSGAINSRLYSVFLNQQGDATGTILFGGVDTSKYTGTLATLDLLPIVQQDQSTGAQSASIFEFVVAVTGLSANNNGKTSTFLSNGDPTGQNTKNSLPVLLDTGSSAWTVPTATYNDIAGLFTTSKGQSAIDRNGNIDCSYQNANINLTVEFGGAVSVDVPAKNFIVPIFNPANNQEYTQNGEPYCAFMIQADSGGQQMSQQGFLTLGDAVLRSMYVVFDLDNAQVSIAQANYNTNIDATSSGSGDNIKVVQSGANGVAKAVGSGVSSVAANSYSIEPEVTATRSIRISTVSPAVATATGEAAIPQQGAVSEAAVASGTGSAPGSTSSKGAASSIDIPAFSWSLLSVSFVWTGMAALGAGLLI